MNKLFLTAGIEVTTDNTSVNVIGWELIQQRFDQLINEKRRRFFSVPTFLP